MAKNRRKNMLVEKYSSMEYFGDKVEWSRRVEKQLGRLPETIVEKFYIWVNAVLRIGLLKTRHRPGLHDEPLMGNRYGQRSVRLNKAYRAIYILKPKMARLKLFRLLRLINMSIKKVYGIADLEKRLGPMTMAMLLRSFRTSQEISQIDFAKKLKISKANLCDIEKGRKLVGMERAAKFAKLLKDSELLYVQIALEDQLRAAHLKYDVFLKKAS